MTGNRHTHTSMIKTMGAPCDLMNYIKHMLSETRK